MWISLMSEFQRNKGGWIPTSDDCLEKQTMVALWGDKLSKFKLMGSQLKFK